MSAAGLKRTAQHVDPGPCVGCGKAAGNVVAFKDGARICEPCAKKTVGIFKANRAAGNEATARRKMLGIREVKGGPLRGAKLRKAKVSP